MMPSDCWGAGQVLRAKLEKILWRLKGSRLPLPFYPKTELLRGLAVQKTFGALVETGTYKGKTLAFLSPLFPRSYSIEIEPKLHAEAQQRFSGRPDIELLLGDSGKVLGELLQRPDFPAGPVLFWLDGHFSGGITGQGELDTPVQDELEYVLKRPKGDLILIDDARCFGAEKDYPSLEQLRASLAQRRPDLSMTVSDDIIRIQ